MYRTYLAMVLHQTKFCMKYHRQKYFGMIFYSIKYFQNQNHQFDYFIKITKHTVLNINSF